MKLQFKCHKQGVAVWILPKRRLSSWRPDCVNLPCSLGQQSETLNFYNGRFRICSKTLHFSFKITLCESVELVICCRYIVDVETNVACSHRSVLLRGWEMFSTNRWNTVHGTFQLDTIWDNYTQRWEINAIIYLFFFLGNIT